MAESEKSKPANSWKIDVLARPKITSPILLEGLPGIGNVGKIVVDYIVEEVKAEKIMTFFSYCLPNSVFVNENNLVALPTLELYYAKIKGQDFLFLAGDVQPATEDGSYSFSELILDIVEKYKCREIITLGGIGLADIPQKAEVYCASNDIKFIDKFVKAGAKKEVYGVVGPIMGITGLLVGLSAERKIKATALLAETFAHPMHLGIKEAKSTIEVLSKVYGIKVNMAELDKEIKAMESEDMEDHDSKLSSLQKLKAIKEMNYIG